MKIFTSIFIFSVTLVYLFFSSANFANAISDPLSVENNRFGIHILSESDLETAANLVNSNGGAWGYVTLVIPRNERDIAKWQKVFDRMRELKLIPLVRLATTAKAGSWEKPEPTEAVAWATFLNSLNWVVKNRYIILFNEPNHDKEWGGAASAIEYAQVVRSFSDELKKASEDYFIMPAGMDLAAGNSRDTINASDFLKRMYDYDKDIFKKFDGWSSHSYPNPGFSGSPDDAGKNSIRGFLWELEYLRAFGLKPNIPVFITETGWIHEEGKVANPNAHKAASTAEFFKSAYEKAWQHAQIVAVTPFILNYENPPFEYFSWVDHRNPEKSFFPQYEVVKNMEKKSGNPEQIHSYKFLESPIPTQLIQDSSYLLDPQMINNGQSIWETGDVTVEVTSTFPSEVLIENPPSLKPFENYKLPIRIQTPSELGSFDITLKFFHKGKPLGEEIVRSIEVIPPTEIQLKASLGWKRDSTVTDMKLLIYEADRLIKEINSLTLDAGISIVPPVHDVIPGQTYRFVLVKSGYLPAQTVTFLSPSGITTLEFGRLLPIDFNSDGKFSLRDIFRAILDPVTTLKIISPF